MTTMTGLDAKVHDDWVTLTVVKAMCGGKEWQAQKLIAFIRERYERPALNAALDLISDMRRESK